MGVPVARPAQRKEEHLDVLDKLPLTKPGDLRHFWMTVAREVAPRHVHRWVLTSGMFKTEAITFSGPWESVGQLEW
ncbi:hypothetical protein I5535_11345 [Rhodobacteraceae bacterium F11138]|nr:hypothetical protein [Rhodobacteraceae bacterium F11138]